MATPEITSDVALPRPIQFLDRWTQVGFTLVVAPLILSGAVSVFMLAVACGWDPWVAWIPAVSTSGVMIMSSQLAMRRGLDAHIKQWATRLTVTAILIEMVVAGLQHTLPTELHPPAIVLFLIGCLPTAMGGATYKLWRLASAAQDAANAAVAQAKLDAIDHAAAQQAETAALAQRIAIQEAADTRKRDAELSHQYQLAALANQAAEAEVRRSQAAQTVAKALKEPQRPHLVPPPATGPVDALGRPAKPSPKRDAALRYLLAEYRNGRDLDTVTAAEVDGVISANGYARKNNNLTTWIADVREYAAKGAA